MSEIFGMSYLKIGAVVLWAFGGGTATAQEVGPGRQIYNVNVDIADKDNKPAKAYVVIESNGGEIKRNFSNETAKHEHVAVTSNINNSCFNMTIKIKDVAVMDTKNFCGLMEPTVYSFVGGYKATIKIEQYFNTYTIVEPHGIYK
jgi:hypothetical protein